MTRILIALVIFGLTSSASLSQTETVQEVETPALEQPQLEPVFSDDFSKDTRADYKISGDVSWEPGKLTLGEGASIQRAIKGGAWAKVELDLERIPLTTEQPTSELRVWFILDGATPCYVRLRWELEDGKMAGSVAIVDTGEKDGKPIERVVRVVIVDDWASGMISVEYRSGLVRVIAQDDQWFAAYIENGSATVGSVTLQSVSTAVGFRNVFAAALPANVREFTEAEQAELAKASVANGEVNALFLEGKYAAAAGMLAEVVDIRKSILGEQYFEYGQGLNNLAVLYLQMSDFAQAEPLYKQALENRKSVLGEQHPEYALSLSNLASLYETIGDYARAEPLCKQALEIRKSILGEQHPDYALSLNNLASLYETIGDYARSEPLYKQALEIRKLALGEQHPDYALSLNNLAGLYESIGDYARSEPLYKQALEIRKSVLGEQHPDYAVSLNNLGVLYHSMGDYARAEPLYKQALEIRKSVLGEQHPEYASSLSNLASLYLGMADYTRAEPLFKQALEITKSVFGERHPEYAGILNNLGGLYSRMGDSAHAELLHKQALEIRRLVLGEQHPDYANSLSHVAELYTRMGDYTRAEPLYEQASEIWKSILGEQHPDYALSLNSLAELYESIGDYARAEPLYKQALEIRKSVLGEQHPDYAVSLNNLAALYYIMGDHARAEPLYKQALHVQRARLDTTALVQSARQQDRNQASLRKYPDGRFAIAVVQKSLSTEPLEDLWLWKGGVTTRQQAYRQVAANSHLAPLFADLQSASRQLSAIEGQRPVAPPGMVSDSAKTAFEQKRKVWTDRFATLNRQREDLEQQIAAGSEEFRRVREPLTVAQVRQWLPPGTAFIDFLEYQHGTPNVEKKGKIDYERRYIAFAVRRDQEPAMIGLGSATALAETITQFRRPFRPGENTIENREVADKAAQQIRRDLWLPIEAHLDGIDTVIISPDTALGTLPFGALPGKKDSSYLLEDYRIAMLPMAGQLRELFERNSDTPANHGLLVLGDVDYDAVPGAPESAAPSLLPLLADAGILRDASQLRAGHTLQWQSLPGFLKELQAVTTLHANQRPAEAGSVLSGARASEAAFLTQAPQYGTLHLITHGYFEDPSVKSTALVDVKQDLLSSDTKGPDPFINTYLPGLLSGLAMAGANCPSDDPEDPRDGILRSSEIEASSMQGVDLVVLSACETGLGAVAGGEGLTGLQRAFQVAGARSVVASLWKVDDDATLTLMTEFYTNLWEKKMSKLDALREAQLAMLRGYNPQTGELTRGLGSKSVQLDPNKKGEPASITNRLDPRYWAAFQLSGDWR